jgi:hypothetical protein
MQIIGIQSVSLSGRIRTYIRHARDIGTQFRIAQSGI